MMRFLGEFSFAYGVGFARAGADRAGASMRECVRFEFLAGARFEKFRRGTSAERLLTAGNVAGRANGLARFCCESALSRASAPSFPPMLSNVEFKLRVVSSRREYRLRRDESEDGVMLRLFAKETARLLSTLGGAFRALFGRAVLATEFGGEVARGFSLLGGKFGDGSVCDSSRAVGCAR